MVEVSLSEPESLPDKVSRADWSLERVRWQNPRLRCLLGCYQVLDRVFDSNFAILNCSPDRLQRITVQVRQVAVTLHDQLGRLLRAPSCIPALERARRNVLLSLCALEQGTLADVLALPETVAEERLDEVRRLFCVAIGQLHSFVLDGLARLLATDPRSQHDIDYFLSRKFPRDVDEAEWLDASVRRLEGLLLGLVRNRPVNLGRVAAEIGASGSLPSRGRWQAVSEYLDELETRLTPQLKRLLCMRGIRYSELDQLESRTSEIPARCATISEQYELAEAMLAELASEESGGDTVPVSLTSAETAACTRLARQLTDLDEILGELSAFVSLWRQSIENRRALFLHTPIEG